MTTQDLYTQKKQCCGCELCSNICPKKLIRMQEDDEGFLYPIIDSEDGCIKCQRCLSICPMKNSTRKGIELNAAFGGQLSNEDDTKLSSSGGFATSISRQFIKNGGIVIGVRYSSDFLKSEYAVATTLDQLERFRTSKYIQAYKGNIYKIVKDNLKNKVLFIGLPCEVSALYNYLGTRVDNLYTISLVCHGPTSSKVQYDYCNNLKKSYNSPIKTFSVRWKEHGWKPYYLRAEFENGEIHMETFKGSSYEVAFQYLKRPSCSSCQYKLGNSDFGLVADLTLGDFHAVETDMPHYNKWGVSQACVQTDKGNTLLKLAKKECNVREISLRFIQKYNFAYHHAVPQKKFREQYKQRYLQYGLEKASQSFYVKIPTSFSNLKRRFKSFIYQIKKIVSD